MDPGERGTVYWTCLIGGDMVGLVELILELSSRLERRYVSHRRDDSGDLRIYWFKDGRRIDRLGCGDHAQER